MISLMVLLILLKTTCTGTSNVGSTLFYNKRGKAVCWTEDELAKLRARKLFHDIMPPPVTPDKINTKFIKDALRYYRGAMRDIEKQTESDPQIEIILKQALLDTIGGHLCNEMLPTVRFAYYAGYVPHKYARQIHDFLERSKSFLNTKGLGWREPKKVPQWANLTVAKVLVGSGILFDPCAYLIMKRDSNSCIHLPSPKLDDKDDPSAIALPFKVNGLVSLTSPQSENVLLKYYTSATRCILRSSPENCRHTDFVNFNNELWHWMKRDVAPHLLDEKLYAAYGGVLRIAAAVQSYGKGLSRRNLFQYQDAGVSKWHPWKALTESYITLDTDWTPTLYVGMVLVAALLICSLQICYNYIFSSGSTCQCLGRSKFSTPREVAYATVDTTFPSMLPNHHSGEINHTNQPFSRMKSAPPSVTTQRVYDLNENAETLMEIIMSDNDEFGSESQSLSKQEESDEAEKEGIVETPKHQRHKKLPELHTPISQLRIEKKSWDGKCSMPMYTTSTATHSEATCQEQLASESMWSGSGSTSSEHTVTSEASKTTSRKSRSSRDLAWARRVINKHATQTTVRSTTGTEFDITSFTTPPSRR